MRRATKDADDKAQIAALLDAYTAAIRAKRSRDRRVLWARRGCV